VNGEEQLEEEEVDDDFGENESLTDAERNPSLGGSSWT